jgi:hypothetical protein
MCYEVLNVALVQYMAYTYMYIYTHIPMLFGTGHAQPVQ